MNMKNEFKEQLIVKQDENKQRILELKRRYDKRRNF